MRETDNFNLTIPEGSDNVNILTQVTPNFETIDGIMKENENAGVQVATVLYSNNIHAITRTKDDASVMRFTATSRFTLGDTFTVDGVQVTALAPTGEQLPDGAFIVGSEVLAILKGTLLTIFAGAKATDSAKLNGQSADFYATKAEVDNAQTLAEGAATIAQNAQAEVNKSWREELIWTNPNPSVAFSGTTLASDLSKYKRFYVETRRTIDSGVIHCEVMTMSATGIENTIEFSGNVIAISARNYAFSNSGVIITDCLRQISGSPATTNNNYLVPLRIYGIY